MNFSIKLLNNLCQIKNQQDYAKNMTMYVDGETRTIKTNIIQVVNKTWMESSLKVGGYIHNKCCNVNKCFNDSFINIR